VIATPNEKSSAIKNTGIAQSISHPNGSPIIVLITRKTKSVGKNLKSAIIVAEIGSMIRGNAVFRIRR
jgi:hypothetical protein